MSTLARPSEYANLALLRHRAAAYGLRRRILPRETAVSSGFPVQASIDPDDDSQRPIQNKSEIMVTSSSLPWFQQEFSASRYQISTQIAGTQHGQLEQF